MLLAIITSLRQINWKIAMEGLDCMGIIKFIILLKHYCQTSTESEHALRCHVSKQT
jgi:hypothetical protein